MFIPTTVEEVKNLGWERLDVILISGDSYIDSPFIGAAVIGKVLLKAGYRVGIIAQPDLHSPVDIMRLGEPSLFWGVTAGSIDSMISNYTATLKKRKSDDYTPGGTNTRRPDRATISYSNLIRRYYKDTVPIVLGGIEASLRRIAHYDYWTDKIRKPVLFDAKADYLVYGMGERTVLDLAAGLKNGRDVRSLRGICYASTEIPAGYMELPPFQEAAVDQEAFTQMFHQFYRNNDPLNAIGLAQKVDRRYLVQNPPSLSLSQAELDDVYALPYEHAQHPYYEKQGKVKALETIRFSVSTHRGCYGECNFCAIAIHEGRTIQWRSPDSIAAEVEGMVNRPGFKGYVLDVGGPTANMYGYECEKKLKSGSCKDKRCLYPQVCNQLHVDHGPLLKLMQRLERIPGIKKVQVSSGVRYDLLQADPKGDEYLAEVVEKHVSGQMKVAPEHTEEHVLKLMGKPGTQSLLRFKADFERLTRKAGKEQYLTYYLIAAHPGCTMKDMQNVHRFTRERLKLTPEQVQVFTPSPSTYSTLMYYTEKDPFTGEKLFVEKGLKGKESQKVIVTGKTEYRRSHKNN
ncbi:MAG: YgiQ family radical SAM protein [Chloroflexi bacterium]|nr:YgiQ family radical SAM protein [Chloroflexota bacterium]